ncbi:hypothetical protein F2P56_027421 [Juglans regia]|uniref:At4g15545-like C-terminal domain-containing protein n=2 Tax=Juglans regia TaxID=51240 RepID=A0A833TPF2_JUGRE|nr:uncharacterized protein At4g15545-like isoform X1 [Juglans regia]KAF5452421.1 hypothetical protein F2P56_027421 [Juglans regia]
MAKDSGGPNFDLPQEVLEVLPSDPFEQLDVARKITSIAISTRVSALESQSSALRSKLADKDQLVADLRAQIEDLDASLSDTADQLALANEEKESLLKQNASLSNTVKKLNRDVSKLEVFRKTLVQSLQEEDENNAGAPEVVAKIQSQSSLSSASQIGDDDATFPYSRYSSFQSQRPELGNSFAEDHEADVRPRISLGLLLASQAGTPQLTPPDSPHSLSASVSPARTSKPVSPRLYSTSSLVHSSHHGSISSSDTGSHSGRTRVDGKEFFRQVRIRVSYEQFGAFLANVKELNAHKQTKEETLLKADEIFGPDNKDLYKIFEGLVTRNVH